MAGVAELLGIEVVLPSEASAATVIMEQAWRPCVAMRLIFAPTTVSVMSAVLRAERLGVVHQAGLAQPLGTARMAGTAALGMAGMAARGTVVVVCSTSREGTSAAGTLAADISVAETPG